MQIEIQEINRILLKRKWVVIFSVIFIVFCTIIITLIQDRAYRSVAVIEVNNEGYTGGVSGAIVNKNDIYTNELEFNTHLQLMKSRPVLKMVLDDIHENDNPILQSSTIKKHSVPKNSYLLQLNEKIKLYKEYLQRALYVNADESNGAAITENLLKSLQNQIIIYPVKNTRLIKVQVIDNDPDVAARKANLLASNYIKFTIQNDLENSQQNLRWLGEELNQLRRKLEEDEKLFFDFKKKNKIFSLDSTKNILDLKIRELNAELLETKNTRKEIQAKLVEIQKANKTEDIDKLLTLISTKDIDTLNSSLNDLEVKLNRATKVFRHKHPEIIKLSSDVNKIQSKIRLEVDKEIETLSANKNLLLAKESSVENDIAELENEGLNTTNIELKYTILNRNMETSQNLYDILASKIKEINLTLTSNRKINIVEHAYAVKTPIKPKTKLNILLSLIFSLFGSIAVCLFAEIINQKIRSEKDITNGLNLPVIACIPKKL